MVIPNEVDDGLGEEDGLGITLTSLGLTLALEPAIHDALGENAAIAAYSAALAMALGAILHVTFGELIPKGIALVVPAKVLYVTAPFMRMFRWLAVPFIKTCNTLANVIVQGITGRNPDSHASHEESVDIGQALFYASRDYTRADGAVIALRSNPLLLSVFEPGP